jgi:hypothetical protein
MKQIDRSEILKEAPDFVQIASAHMQNSYIDYELKRRALDESSDRFLTYIGKNNETHVIDLKYVNVKGIMKSRGARDEDIADAQEIRKEIILPLIAEYNHAKQRYYNTFDLYNDRSKALAKLTPQLIDLFGSMCSAKDVKKIIKSREGYDLNDDELTKFYNENKNVIESRQAKYLLKSDKYKVATESGRLEIINDMLTDLYLKYEYYINNDQETKALNMSREVRNLLEQARKEVKGNELKLTVDGKIDINATIHGGENVTRIMREIPINSIIIGLVAAKSGIRPEILIHQLATSWYKDFNGFNKNILGQEKIQLPGDMIKAYDWGELQVANSTFLHEMNPIEITDAQVIEEKVGQEKKKELLQRLKQMKRI